LEKTVKKQSFAEEEGRILIPIGGYSEKRQILFSPKRRTYPENSKGLDVKQIPEIKSWFEEHKVPDLSMLLLATSKRLLLQGDYRLSSILAITALEAPLKVFIKKRCKIKKISRNCETVSCNLNKLYSILESNELTDWVQKWLGPHWDGDTVSGNQIISCTIEFNKKRNDAIHEGIMPDFDAVDQGIFVVEALCAFIKKAI